MFNRVISPYAAIVDGKETGLARCDSRSCGRSCLRKSRILECAASTDEQYNCNGQSYIPDADVVLKKSEKIK